MNILFTGKTDFTYNRVQILLKGLQKIGVQVTIVRIFKRNKEFISLFKEAESKADYIYIPPFRHRDVSFIKKLTQKPIVFDPLVSKYLTKDDFGQFWKKPYKYFLDKIPFSKCDILLSDTQSHKEYFAKTFHINKSKIHCLPIGIDSDLFYKENKTVELQSTNFNVGFYGSFVPLQGVEQILQTAIILREQKNIHFHIIGNGYDYDNFVKNIESNKLTNITLHGWVDYNKLNSLINNFSICLGIFGKSEKADLVIPNKIYHYAVAGKCIITKRTKGIEELFTHNKDIVLCNNNPQEIAELILQLSTNYNKVTEIGENAYKLVWNNFNEVKIAERFIEILQSFKK